MSSDYYAAVNMRLAKSCVECRKKAKRIEELESRVEKYEELDESIRSWAEAYPKDIFPPIEDWGAVRERLDGLTDGDTLLRVAADNMRYVATGIAKLLPGVTDEQ